MYLIVQPFWIDETCKEPIRPFLIIVPDGALTIQNPKASRRFLQAIRIKVFQLPINQDANYEQLDSKTFWKAWKQVSGGSDEGGTHDRLPVIPKGPKPSSGIRKRMELAGVRS